MRQIKISDATMKQISESFCLSFKEKIEFSKLLDRLGADVIELEGIENPRIDSLRIKSIAAAVTESTVAVPVGMNAKSIVSVCSRCMGIPSFFFIITSFPKNCNIRK